MQRKIFGQFGIFSEVKHQCNAMPIDLLSMYLAEYNMVLFMFVAFMIWSLLICFFTIVMAPQMEQAEEEENQKDLMIVEQQDEMSC